MKLLEFFFVDHTTGYSANKAIIRRMITSLHYSSFVYGNFILRKGLDVFGVIFLKEHGISILGINESVRLVDYYENSFIGEFETIFQLHAERSYVAVNK